ncbi:MAG: xanthine dehydrogenase family protein molybdopterin-binding subunit [Deltaproteobacteria bacterium]|nr:xanthine dehydrogenase family protein molybdopterin-binding subunit [Deltaproteobacteria bacterium]MBI2533139.1 xanthine dehydrogenase family protein molybdopterin-binding subunit [Deltaproteobacteria bacterium]
MPYKNIGKSVPRLEGAEKVDGRTRYAADIDLPGALWARLLRSPLPHARILSVDTSKAARLAGVRAVISGPDIPPVLTGLRMKDMPVLARERVRYVGEPVAAVAADSPEIAEEALSLIDVQYEGLPFVTDPVEAIRPGAPVLHENPAAYKNAPERTTDLPNVQSLGQWSNGDIEAGFKKAARVFEHTFRTPLGFHAYIEPHACAVRIGTGGQIEIWASNKSPFTLRDRLARDLDLDAKKIKVHILPVGGDFGGKTSVIEVPLCYFLAERAGKPVKMVHSYAEELAAAAHRHPAVITLRTGVDGDFRLCALDVNAIFSGGAYAALKANAEVTVQGPRRVASYYRIPAIRVETLCAYTNQVSCTQTRTPGSPQVVFAMESQIDIIARALGMDPVAFRRKNLLNDGDPSPFGQKLKGILAKETFKKAVDAAGWKKPKAKNVGRGVAIYERPSGAGRSGAAITVDGDGGVTVQVGVPDVGPGIHTVVQQIVSEVLEVQREKVSVRVDDTDSSPYDSGTGGSKSTNSVGHAAYQAASEIKEKILALAAGRLGCKPEEIKADKGRYAAPGRKATAFTELMRLAVEENRGPITHLSVYEPSRAPITSFAAQVAEVEVDPATGQVKVRKLTTVHDAGRVLNHLTYQGQVDGGVVTGLGFALMEDNSLVDGKIAVGNLGEFKIPNAADVPKLTTLLMESATGPAPFAGKAIAEIPNVPTAAAVANAIEDAVGVRIFDLPLTAEKIYAALKTK